MNYSGESNMKTSTKLLLAGLTTAFGIEAYGAMSDTCGNPSALEYMSLLADQLKYETGLVNWQSKCPPAIPFARHF